VTVNNEYLSVRMLFPEPVNHLRHDCGELRPSLSTPGEELASSAAPSSSGHVCSSRLIRLSFWYRHQSIPSPVVIKAWLRARPSAL
jgi:hypothetical protein